MAKDGILSAEMVSEGMVHQERFVNRLQHMYRSLSLSGHNLSDVSVLSNYVHLQKLILPHNRIKDLSCVSHMPCLVILDASHNEISTFFDFEPPKKLKEVNFSYNLLTEMKSLFAYESLSKLILNYNSISEITGLEQCYRLTHLSLAHNKISRISGLDGLPLTYLCLRGNQLQKIDGLENVKSLQVLDLSLNRVTCLTGLQSLQLLCSVNLEKNQISEIHECKHIHNLLLLRDLNLLENPLQEQPNYRLAVIFLLQHLTMLDQEVVTAEEKVTSVNKYDPPMDLVAARDHMTNLVYQLMQPQVLFDSTLPSVDSPYPLLVLTGPQGCGKRELVHRLCQEFCDYFCYGLSHATREPYSGEENGIDYHFINEEDFQNMIRMGKFIQTMQYKGHRFGLSRDTIEGAAREGLACCVHMELEGALSLKKSCFKPRFILVIPSQEENYISHLKSRGLYTPAQIDAAVSRIDLYIRTNEQHPGFFDNVVPCDDWEEAYQSLRQIVMEDLLLEEEEGQRRGKVSTSTGHDSAEKAPPQQSEPASEPLASLSASLLDPSGTQFNNIQAKIGSHKSSAEAASIRRREQLLREALLGKSPGVCRQLFKRTYETRRSSALSVPSSAGALMELLAVSIPGQTQEALKDDPGSSQASLSGVDHPMVAVSPSSEKCPKSNLKSILPPIPNGRKSPAATNPGFSPKLSTNPGVSEGGK
uniref:Leucine-rich repeats and guanylate kinase domain containing n=1 Tax=Oryzias latipes TaxID=8090 RepID=A0A3P9I075_ORYLA